MEETLEGRITVDPETYLKIQSNGLKDTTTGRVVALGDIIDVSGYAYRTPSGAMMFCAERCVTVKQAQK